MKRNLASAPAKVWNLKNEPTDVERMEEMSDTTEILKELPAAAAGFARRYRTPVMLSLAVLGALGFFWYLAKQD